VQISRIRPRKAPVALAALVALGLGLVAIPSAQAQTLTIIHSFAGTPDGETPEAGLIRDEAGNLYGTTAFGGDCNSLPTGCGTVFKFSTSGSETLLYSFGAYPGDGTTPFAGLIRDRAGNLYGATLSGGEYGYGTIFKLDASGNETLLHSFAGYPTDGAYPWAGLIMDRAGNLYDTTSYGGDGTCQSVPPLGCGTVFKLGTSGNEKVLYSFAGSPTDAAYPGADLIMDKAGNLYGTTTYGGTGTCVSATQSGCGTVFKLDTSGNETVFHYFTGSAGDGAGPSAPLIADRAGNLYGTTSAGGTFRYGTVFKLDTSGNLIVLHSFNGPPPFDFEGPPSDGMEPDARLIMEERGNLYGETFLGGSFNQGTVFELDTSGNLTVLHSFNPYSHDGAAPAGGLVMDKAGNFYGISVGGGAQGVGTVFELIPRSPQQATQTIIDAVNALYSQGVLSSGEDNALVLRLEKAISLMNAGRDGAATLSLREFILEVLALQRWGVFSPSQAAPLISAAKGVIAQLL